MTDQSGALRIACVTLFPESLAATQAAMRNIKAGATLRPTRRDQEPDLTPVKEELGSSRSTVPSPKPSKHAASLVANKNPASDVAFRPPVPDEMLHLIVPQVDGGEEIPENGDGSYSAVPKPVSIVSSGSRASKKTTEGTSKHTGSVPGPKAVVQVKTENKAKPSGKSSSSPSSSTTSGGTSAVAAHKPSPTARTKSKKAGDETESASAPPVKKGRK